MRESCKAVAEGFRLAHHVAKLVFDDGNLGRSVCGCVER